MNPSNIAQFLDLSTGYFRADSPIEPIAHYFAPAEPVPRETLLSYRNKKRQTVEQRDQRMIEMVASFKRPVNALEVVGRFDLVTKYTMHQLHKLADAGRLKRTGRIKHFKYEVPA